MNACYYIEEVFMYKLRLASYCRIYIFTNLSFLKFLDVLLAHLTIKCLICFTFRYQ